MIRAEEEPDLLGPGGWSAAALAGLRAVSGGRVGPPVEPGRAGLDVEVAAALAGRPGALVPSLQHLRTSARSVREFLSGTTWRVLGMLEAERAVLDGDVAGTSDFTVVESLDRVLVASSALIGLANDATVRGPAWRFLDLGRRIERALLLLGLVEASLVPAVPPAATQALYETVLTATESLVEYRRRYRSDLALDAIVDLLLVDDANPRSLAFQLDRLTEDLAGLPSRGEPADHAQLVDASARALAGGVRPRPGPGRADVRGPLLALADGIVGRWFGDETTGRRFRRVAG